MALQRLVAGRHRHGLPRDATATFNVRNPRSAIFSIHDLRSVALQRLVAGRHRHGLPRDATATFKIRDPRSTISAVGGIWARSQGIGDAFGLEIDDLRLGVGLGFTGVMGAGMERSAVPPFSHAMVLFQQHHPAWPGF